MIILLAIYAVVIASLISGILILKGKQRKFLLSLTVIFVVLPLCILSFFGIFKSQMQQGKLLQGFGPLLLLVSPPEDLSVPLASENIVPSKQEYQFHFKHKYVGNYIVELSFRKLESMEYPDNNLELQYIVSSGDKIVFSRSSKKGWPYWGKNTSGLTFVSYNVPEVLPVDHDLFASITIKGDINAFINKYGPAQMIIRKGSDE